MPRSTLAVIVSGGLVAVGVFALGAGWKPGLTLLPVWIVMIAAYWLTSRRA